MKQQSFGKLGEALARNYLKKKHYIIVEQNWHCRQGEIDIVARDGSILVFCEVKTRRRATIGEALINITESKRRKMILAAQQYVHEHEPEDTIWRIDAVAVVIQDSRPPKIEHVEDVLDW